MTSVRDLQLRASLLSHFELPWLGVPPDVVEELGPALFPDSTRVETGDGTRHWRLNDAARRSVVHSATFPELRDAWRSLSHRPVDDRQWAIDQYVGRLDAPELGSLDLGQLQAVTWLLRWLDGPSHLPDEEEVARSLGFARLLTPLRQLADEHFVGREGLLAELAHDHVPMVIHGQGGVGKSALVARHLLQMASHGLLISYLNFDNSALDPAAPETLIAAIAQQLSVQLPGREAENLAAAALEGVRANAPSNQSSFRTTSIRGGYGDLLSQLRDVITGRRLVIVFDTFEEVQRRDHAVQGAFAGFVAALWQRVVPVVVLAGRAPTALFPSNRALTGLEPEEATRLLRRLVSDVPDPDHVIEQVGTSPLCVRLAAGILNHHPPGDPLRDLALRRGALEGELYHRLLGHIADPEVRRLAHPGLTLRRVTPELIREVLGEPCDVDVLSPVDARRLFDGLAREAMLVDLSPSGDEVFHRLDVRQMMLPRLAEDDPETVAEIHRLAVEYYERRKGVAARAEELYHRLMLGQDRETLDRKWDDAALHSLVVTMDELPPAGKAYLAAKSPNLSVSDDDLREADLADQRELIVRRVQELISDNEIPRALAELTRHREEAGDDSLAVVDLLVQALELHGDIREALQEAREGWERAARVGTTQEFYGLTFHVARLEEVLGRFDEAETVTRQALGQSLTLAETNPNLLIRLKLMVFRLRLHRRSGVLIQQEADVLADEAVALYDRLTPRVVGREPGLLRDLAAEVGEAAPRVLSATLRVVGLDEVDAKASTLPVSAYRDPGSTPVGRHEIGNRLSDLVDADEVPDEAYREVTEAYRQEAEDAYHGSTPFTEAPLSDVGRTKLEWAAAMVTLGCAEEAAVMVDELLPVLRPGGSGLMLAEAEHLRAVAALLMGQNELARELARSAERRFDRLNTPRKALAANVTRLRARVRLGAAADEIKAAAEDLVPKLLEQDMPDEAVVAVLLWTHHQLRSGGQPFESGQQVDSLAPRAHAADLEMLYWLCRAEIALANGDERLALAVAETGIELLESLPHRPGTKDFPTGTAMHGRDLAALAANILLRRGDLVDLFEWLDRTYPDIYSRYHPLDPPVRPRRRSFAEISEALGDRAFGFHLGQDTLMLVDGELSVIRLTSDFLRGMIPTREVVLAGSAPTQLATAVPSASAWVEANERTGIASRVVTPPATRAAVLEAFESGATVLLTMSGQHMPDNAWFSRLELDDGPLHAYEIRRLERSPALVFLIGMPLGQRGLGLAGALLECGVRTVVVPTGPVVEPHAHNVVAGVMEGIDKGLSVREALARAIVRDPAHRPFVCVGAG